jgi:FkbM family methyltransferase
MGELLPDLIHSDLNFKNGFYIEAGANDGIRQSNTLYLEKNLGWKGILIEPNIKKMLTCKYYRDPSNFFYNCALSSDETIDSISGNFNEDCSGESLMACSSALLSLDYYDEIFKNEIKQKIKTREQILVPAKTLNSILKENNIIHVDFLSLDLEGYELEALKNFNFNEFNINYILIETAARPLYKESVYSFMKSKGYIYYEKISNNDDLFKKETI